MNLRFASLVLLLAMAAHSQENPRSAMAPAPSPAPPQTRAAPAKVCAVPLLNAGRLPHLAPMPRLQPLAGRRFFIRPIRPPAPACTSFGPSVWRSEPPSIRP